MLTKRLNTYVSQTAKTATGGHLNLYIHLQLHIHKLSI